MRKILVVLFIVSMTGAPSFAAIGSDGEATTDRHVEPAAVDPLDADVAADEAASFREAGEKVCREAVGVAAAFGQQFSVLREEVPRVMSQLGEQFARDVAPAMREFGERAAPAMRDLVEQLRRAAKEFERSNSERDAAEGRP